MTDVSRNVIPLEEAARHAAGEAAGMNILQQWRELTDQLDPAELTGADRARLLDVFEASLTPGGGSRLGSVGGPAA